MVTSVSKSKARRAAIKYGYRSGLEKDNADYLDSLGIPYTYEEKKITWEDFKVRTYTPDFELENGIIVETKGRFVAADRRKHLEIKKQYPDLDIRFVFSNPNAKLSKGSNTSYSQWCDKNGFKYASKTIPLEWIYEEPKDD